MVKGVRARCPDGKTRETGKRIYARVGFSPKLNKRAIKRGAEGCREAEVGRMMQRRTFIQRLLGSVGVAASGTAIAADTRSIPIQESCIAGFQFHQGEAVWASLAVGDKLVLVREVANKHDVNAVAVYFRNRQLGYVPRAENSVIAQLLDRGERLESKITALRDEEDPWRRISFSVALV